MAAKIRRLREQELPQWLDLLEAAFAQKGTPRTYFESHVACDPFYRPEDIFVAEDATGQFVSTCRVFRRRVHLGTAQVAVAGLGEVATLPSNRGQGLARQLLEHVAQTVSAESERPGLLLLHTSKPALQEYYARLGYRSVRSSWTQYQLSFDDEDATVSPVATGNSGDNHEQSTVSKVQWDKIAINTVQPLFERLRQLSDDLRPWNGRLVRDVAYWNRWVSAEMRKPNVQLFVRRRCGSDDLDTMDAIEAYACFRARGHIWQLAEAAGSDVSSLVNHACRLLAAQQQDKDDKAADSSDAHESTAAAALGTMQVQIADAVLHIVRFPDHIVTATTRVVDNGWMYSTHDPASLASMVIGGREEAECVSDMDAACRLLESLGEHYVPLLDAF